MRADNMTTRAGRAGRKQDVMRRRSDEMRVLNTRNRRRALHILSYSKWINEMRRIIILDMLVCDSQARFVCLHSGTPGVYASDGAGMSDWRQPKGQERFLFYWRCGREVSPCARSALDSVDGRKSLLTAARWNHCVVSFFSSCLFHIQKLERSQKWRL